MGASGDLAKKKTYPALYALWKARLLPRETIIWGFARSPKEDENFRNSFLKPFLMAKNTVDQESQVDAFLSQCFYRKGSSYGDWQGIQSILSETKHENTLIYLAIPPHGKSTTQEE